MRALRAALGTLAACAALLALAGPASASYQRPFVEVFGSAEEPTFTWPSILAVQPGGDLLVGDKTGEGNDPTGEIRRFKPNGEPDPFAALGTNAIDGKRTSATNECPTAPADCDETPQNGLEVSLNGSGQQISVSPVTGDLFVTQFNSNLVDIFSPEGRYLGQLTRSGTKKLVNPIGVVVDSSGIVYVSQGKEILKYVPSGDPPVNTDYEGNFTIPSGYNVGRMALGSGPSAGKFFLGSPGTSGSVPSVSFEVNKETGASHVFAEDFHRLVTVDPTSGNPIIKHAGGQEAHEAAEFDGAAETAAAPLSRLDEPWGIDDLAANESGQVYVVNGPSDPRVTVYGNPVLVPTVHAQPAEEITTNEATLRGAVDPEGLGLEGCHFEALSASAPHKEEAQKVTLSGATGGTFTLSFEGETTKPIPYAASGQEIAWALQELPAIGGRNVFANGSANSFTLYFLAGLDETDVPQVEADGSSLTPGGASIEVETLRDGEGWGSDATILPCEPEAADIATESGPQEVEAKLAGLLPNGVEYVYRLSATNENGTETSGEESLVTAHGVVTEAATVTGRHSATLNGTIRPEGLQYDECFFKWGPVSNPSENEAPCVGSVPPDSSAHPVGAELTGLGEGTEYRFTLFAKPHEEGLQEGQELSFETFGPLSIDAVRASNASQSSVTLEADINPHGLDTSYRFEWGPTESYGHFAPASFESIGNGADPVQATARISGLSPASTYHFKVIAESEAGEDESEDATAETLNSCGLPDNRCFELVSKRDAGPFSIPGEYGSAGAGGVNFQAAPRGPGALAYPVESGYPDATKGATTIYRGARNEAASEWGSTQLSPPVIGENEKTGGTSSTSVSSAISWLSGDLSCGFTKSWRLLTEDPAMRLAYEEGGANLYRINPNGTYTPVTYLAPENPDSVNYTPVAGSQDCSKFVFESAAHYPGIPSNGKENLYEWEEGQLRNAGWIPGPSGDVAVAAAAGGGGGFSRTEGDVSEDAVRIFFSAKRLVAGHPGNSGEVGKTGIFVREDGTVTRDVSASETSTPDEGATYQWATPDGSKVFFTANHGLTGESSPSGTDLYEYDLQTEALTDLSVTAETGGAQVYGVFGGSEDGTVVYFLAKGQLVAGKGRTLAENESAETESIYRVTGGTVSFVATIPAGPPTGVVMPRSQVSPEGGYLAFESSANVTGYDSGGAGEAYLYDADAGGEGKTLCASCRPDGEPPVRPGLINETALPVGTGVRFLTVSGGQAKLFFYSNDALAPGAIEGQNNVYEWAHGQVFRLSSEEGRLNRLHPAAIFAAAAADGSDAYIFTPETLTWEDGDERISVYDARVGGGFPEPPAPPAPCDPNSEGSCQGGPGSSAAAPPAAASKDFAGPGNVTEAGNGAAKRCSSSARQAQRLSARAEKLRRNARKLGRHGHRARAVALNRKAGRLAGRAKSQSKRAKRCRARVRKSRRAHR